MSDLPQEFVGSSIDAVVKDPARADAMLTENPGLLNARWIHNETVLHFLAIEGFSDGVRFMVLRSADVNAIDEFGDTPLVNVAVLGRTEIADILLRHGADPNVQSGTQDNPLHAAARGGHADLVRRLLAAGADAQYRTGLGETVFDAVKENPNEEQKELMAALTEAGVRPPKTE
jgi:ankyrin repeat protein